MTAEEFAKRFDVSRETLASLSVYVALLEKWQSRINLVSPATLPDIWHRHILDSAQLVPYLPVVSPRQRCQILDIGSGAGFPGLVLAILGAGDVQLVESDQRKAVFLQTVIRELGLSARVSNHRIETLPACQPDVNYSPRPRRFAKINVTHYVAASQGLDLSVFKRCIRRRRIDQFSNLFHYDSASLSKRNQ